MLSVDVAMLSIKSSLSGVVLQLSGVVLHFSAVFLHLSIVLRRFPTISYSKIVAFRGFSLITAFVDGKLTFFLACSTHAPLSTTCPCRSLAQDLSFFGFDGLDSDFESLVLLGTCNLSIYLDGGNQPYKARINVESLLLRCSSFRLISKSCWRVCSV